MNRRNFKLILSLLGLILIVSCDGGSSFKGIVRDPGGRPVSGARLIFETLPVSRKREAVTNEDGSFSTMFLHSPYGRVQIHIVVTKEGYKTYTQDISAGHYEKMDIVMNREGVSKQN